MPRAIPPWACSPSPSVPCQSALRSTFHLRIWPWRMWCCNCNRHLTDSVCCLCPLFFLTRRSELQVRLLKKEEFSVSLGHAKNIVSLGTAGFIMQLTNSLVTICCNHVLSMTGGDIYISVMTIVSSVRQLVETPIYALTEGSSPIISYNYGARRPTRVKKAGSIMSLLVFAYTAVMWAVIILIPHTLIQVFSSDASLISDSVPAFKTILCSLYFYGFAIYRSDHFQILK